VRDAALRLAAAGAPPTQGLWCIDRDADGRDALEEIAFSSPHLRCLVMGTSDLAKDLRARSTRDRLPVLTALTLCVMAARAAGLAVIDGVHLDLDDEDGSAVPAARARSSASTARRCCTPRPSPRQRDLRSGAGGDRVVEADHHRPRRRAA
jgi:citrate lyase subunit beta/citryl-CoA lyase